ncbi:MAG: site-specific integrase [Oscillospiraceae bacterium]|nr:site-specific integrase [Oscillospiraceae bacterium]
MANIRKIRGVNGISYKITVTHGLDGSGSQIRHYMTYTPPQGISDKRAEKEAQKAAAQFENEILQGYRLDNKQTFSEYADYVLDLKRRNGAKRTTIEGYGVLMKRIKPAIGHIKLCELRPQHLNAFYKNLSESGIRATGATAAARVDLCKILKEKKMPKECLAKAAGVGTSTVLSACRGKQIEEGKAAAIAKTLGRTTNDLFTVDKKTKPLSQKTITEYHRLIRAILTQAEKEMLVPCNAAQKATPPKVPHHEPNYFQPQEIAAILDALETEPIKWRTITHLLIVTGCRRGEIMGLKWDKVDLKNRHIRIDSALMYSSKAGLYQTSTKTGDIRTLTIPDETVTLLRQYQKWQLEMRIANGDRWHETGYMFTRDNGEPCPPDGITQWLAEFSRRHDLPHINPHAFRHTAASMLIANGLDIVTVSKQLGHASPTTTESFYAHIIDENLAKASECIADVLIRRKQA